MLPLLLLGFAQARDVVLVGERYAPPDHGGWPAALQTCLAAVRPGAYTLVDATTPGGDLADARRRLVGAPPSLDAIVFVSVAAPRGPFARVRGLRALSALLVALEGRTAVLFGPFPAARRRVRGSGSVPDSAAGIVEESADWRRYGAVAAEAGVAHPTYKLWEVGRTLPSARAAAGPPPEGPWLSLPDLSPRALGKLACADVLGVDPR